MGVAVAGGIVADGFCVFVTAAVGSFVRAGVGVSTDSLLAQLAANTIPNNISSLPLLLVKILNIASLFISIPINKMGA
jgi:hypothetical protein